MAHKLKFNKLTKDQTHFLVDFIKECFPEKEDETFNSNNDLKFISVTFHRVFKKYYGFGLSIRNIIYAFEKNNYVVYLKKGDDISIKEEKEAEKKEKPNFNIDLYTELGVDNVYIKIDGKKIHNYIRAAYDLPPTAHDIKVQYIEKVVKELNHFKYEWDLKNENKLNATEYTSHPEENNPVD